MKTTERTLLRTVAFLVSTVISVSTFALFSSWAWTQLDADAAGSDRGHEHPVDCRLEYSGVDGAREQALRMEKRHPTTELSQLGLHTRAVVAGCADASEGASRWNTEFSQASKHAMMNLAKRLLSTAKRAVSVCAIALATSGMGNMAAAAEAPPALPVAMALDPRRSPIFGNLTFAAEAALSRNAYSRLTRSRI